MMTDDTATLDIWYKTEPYQRLIQAVRNQDAVGQIQIIEEQIAACTGADKAFWLGARAGYRASLAYHTPAMRDLAWADVEESLRTAPENRLIRETALNSALAFSYDSQRLDRLLPMFRELRKDLPRLKRLPFFQHNVGLLYLLQGHWAAALQAFTRAKEGLLGLSEEGQRAFKGLLAVIMARRAVAAVACGLGELAGQEAARSWEMVETGVASKAVCMVPAIAMAEVALSQGRCQEARASLQKAWTLQSGGDYPKTIPVVKAETELLAARIARAEGNQKGFEHFCSRALVLAAEHRLPMSAARVRAVKDGAER